MVRQSGVVLCVVAVVFGLVGSLGRTDEPQLVASLDKRTAQVNEEVHLQIKITGASRGVQTPVLPPLEAFEIFYSGRASHFTYVNGRTESRTEFKYVLIPKIVGQFVIEPIELKLDGKIYRTEQLEINIEGSRAAATQPTRQPVAAPLPGVPSGFPTTTFPTSAPAGSQASSAALARDTAPDPNIFLRVVPSSVAVYTNEQLILSYSIYTRYDTRYEGFEEEPETSGFWIEEFPMDYKELGRDTDVVDGRRYVRADIKKIALFPTAPGQYVIKPGTIKTSVQIQERTSSLFDEFFSDSFFGSAGLFSRRATKYLTAPEIQVVVNPLPEAGKPAGFKGAVGDFRMLTEVDKRGINQNEAVTLKITIEGQGNIETLSLADIPEPPATKIYESDTHTQLFRQQNVIAGSKTFEIIFIPAHPGELIISPIEFSFFNPRSERYVTLKSEPYVIKVEPSQAAPVSIPKGIGETDFREQKKLIQLEGEDIYYIKERLSSERSIRPDMFIPWFALLNGALTLAAVGLGIARQRSAYLERNVSVKRTLLAKKYAMRGLKHLDRLARAPEDNLEGVTAFFNESAKVLSHYLSNKLNLSAHGMIRDVMDQELARRVVGRETIAKIHDCFDRCDQIRFGRIDIGGKDRTDMIMRIRDIVNALEKK